MSDTLPRLEIAAAALVCFAIFVAALASVMDRLLEVFGILHSNPNPNVAAGVPGDKLWTSILCLCSLAAGACVAVQLVSKRLVTGRLSERLAVAGLSALPIVSVASLAARWLVLNHGSSEYLDAMMRGLTYWTAVSSLALSAMILGIRSNKAFQALLITIVAASTLAAIIGIQDYLVNVFAKHITGWREFGTSTPDFYAAFLLVTLPICFGAFLAASERDSSLAYGFCTALQLPALLTTGSRFAFISLAVEAVVFAVGCVALRRSGRFMPDGARSKLIGMAAIAVVGGLLCAGPLLHRLQASGLRNDANSGKFRLYTWRGAVSLWKAYPALGTGPNLFQYDYPRYAVAGFTRLAHSGYLQLLDELGPSGLVAVLFVIGGSMAVIGSALRAPRYMDVPGVSRDAQDETGYEPLVLIGTASGVIGLAVQNLIDSDWMVTICGATWFAAVGLLLAAARRMQSNAEADVPHDSDRVRGSMPVILRGVAVCALLLAACCLRWCIGGWQERQGDYGSAYAVVPFDGEYAGSCGIALENDPAQSAAALSALQASARLTPNPTAFRRLAEMHSALGDEPAALLDIVHGLEHDPHDLALLLMIAQLNDARHHDSVALQYYKKMADLQLSPYGTVTALGGVVEYRYAYADAALASDALNRGDSTTAVVFALRAKSVLDEYLAEGGTSNLMRAAMGGSASSGLDARLQALYVQTMLTLSSAYERSGQSAQAAKTRAESEATTPLFVPKPPPTAH